MVQGTEAATVEGPQASTGKYTSDRAEKPWLGHELITLLVTGLRGLPYVQIRAMLGRTPVACETALKRLLNKTTPCPAGGEAALAEAVAKLVPTAKGETRTGLRQGIRELIELATARLAVMLANGETTRDELKYVLPWPLDANVILKANRILEHRRAVAPLLDIGQGDSRRVYPPPVAPDAPFPAAPAQPSEAAAVGDVPPGTGDVQVA